MNHYRFYFISLCFLTLFSPVEGGAEQTPHLTNTGPLLLEDALSEALSRNPGLAKVASQARALSHRPPQAGALPDPQLHFNIQNLPTDTFDAGQEAMTQFQIAVMQGLPFPGKLALKEEAALHKARASGNMVRETRLEVIRDVKTRWWSILDTDRALEIVQRNKRLLQQFVEIAQTKYKVGKGLQQDVLLAQLELSKLLDFEITLQAKRRKGESALNAVLNRPTDQSLRLPNAAEETLPAVPNEQQLLQDYKRDRPVVAALQDEIAVAHARLSLSKKGYDPDFKFGVVYGRRQGQNPGGSDRADFASLLFSMNLPVYGKQKQDKTIDQGLEELTTRRLALEEKQRHIEAAISDALASYRQLREQVSLFKTGIIPQAKQTVASMLAGYQVNKVDFLNLVRAQLTLYNYEIQYWKTLSGAHQTLAVLAHAAGKEQIHEK